MTLGYNGGNGNVTQDPNKIPAAGMAAGTGFVSTSGALTYDAISIPSANYIEFGLAASGAQGFSGLTGSTLLASGYILTIHAKVPIVGWSSNTAIGQDAALGPIEAQYNTLSSTTMTVGTALNFTTVSYDNTGILSGGAAVVKTSGYYKAFFGGMALSGGAANISVYVNGVSRVANAATLNGTYIIPATVGLKLNAGDSVTLVPSGSVTAASTAGFFGISIDLGPQTISPAASEAFDYYGSTQTITTSTSVIINPTKLTDTLAGMNTSTGLYTVRNTGTFHCDCQIFGSYSTASNINLFIYLNGSQIGPELSGSSSVIPGSSWSGDIPALAGQTLGCYVQSGAGSSTATYGSQFSCHRVGF
jgi:hypothetical protein